MLVLHLISIASHSARNEPVTIKVLLLLFTSELEGNAILSVSEALANIIIVDVFVESSCLTFSKAWQIASIC